ncbi:MULTISPECIES: hypothetical protein [unclassified Isoptericola]|uniref:hypothetical protein n=1 Tax=unclassified Isoptericola TaxID=2623355 RepID=UPI00365EB773
MTDLHPVPTPRDVRGMTYPLPDEPNPEGAPVYAASDELPLRDATPEEVDGITRIVATAVGLDPADVVERVRAVPVLDAPARQDAPSERVSRPSGERTPFDIRVRMLDETAAPVFVSNVVEWKWREEGRLDVYAVVDDRVHRVESWGPYTAARVSRVRPAVLA